VTRAGVLILLKVSVVGGMLPAFAQELKPRAQAAKTDLVEFAPGGTLRIDRSYGDLNVEGWDRSEVEIKVIKTAPYDDKRGYPEQSARLEKVQVVAKRVSETELSISTTRASRHDVIVQYEIHVPRDTRLVIHHGTGSVSVSDVSGDIEASVGRGDIVLWVPPDSYSVDAKTRLGIVTSELEGASTSRYLFGRSFTQVSPARPHRLYLRMGFGGITIKRKSPGPVN
jgi:hypothetical protein